MKIFGIPLRIEPVFFIVVAILGAMGGGDVGDILIWVGAVLFSVLWHELGHAFMVRLYGGRPRIVLHGFGGTTSWRAGPAFGPGRHIAVSLAGPFFGFLVGGLTYAVWRWQADAIEANRLARTLVYDLLWVNVGWGVLNLLPILPLDGGNVMRSVLHKLTGGKGDRAALMVSFVLGVALAGVALLQRELWAAVLFGWIAADNYRAWRSSKAASAGTDAGPVWLEAAEAVRSRDAEAAREAARRMASLAERDDDARILAPVVQAWAARLSGDVAGAEAAWASAGPEARSLPAANGWLHLAAGEPEEAERIFQGAFESDPARGADAGLATAYARAGHLDEAVALSRGRYANQVGPWYLRALQAETFEAKRFEDAVEAGRRLHDRYGDPLAAYDVACALVRLDRFEEAVGWLRNARQAGWLDRETVRSDPDLAPLHGRADFETLADEL